jgi:aryl carrier-like protein
MVPAAFVELPALPLTPNGKLDRKALPAPTPLQAQPHTPFAAAGTRLEQTIADIWQELLQVPRVGLHDNFFDLGGHSILLAQMQTRLKAATGHDLPLVALFQLPTVSALAMRLSDGVKENSLHAIQERAARQRRLFGATAANTERRAPALPVDEHRTGALPSVGAGDLLVASASNTRNGVVETKLS